MAVVGWGMSPSDFWNMTPAEFWRIHERKRPRDPERDYAGGLTDESIDELMRQFDG